MADAFSTASQDIENQRRQAVAAIAASGSAGAQAIANAQSQISSLRAQALNGALASAASKGVPTAGEAELSSIINRPYDLLGASTAQMGASQATERASQGASANNYFSQIGAAVPVARNALTASIAQAYAKANAAAQAKAAASANGSNLSDSELRTRLMGAGDTLQQQSVGDASHLHHITQTSYEDLKGQLNGLEKTIAQRKANAKTNGPHPVTDSMETLAAALQKQVQQARSNRNASTQAVHDNADAPVEGYARKAGAAAGLDQNLVNGLIRMPKPKATNVKPQSLIAPVSDAARRIGLNPKVLNRIIAPSKDPTKSTIFEVASAQAEAAIKAGIPLDTFRKDMALRVPKQYKRTQALILAIYGPAFQG